MRSTLVIARRELLEKRFVFAAAAAFALLSILIPLIPGVRHESREQVLVILSTIFAANFPIALALILGVSIIGRDLSERRLSFYFSKPVSPSSIWFGKVIASLVLIFVSGAIIAAPALIAGFKSIVEVWTVPAQGTPRLLTILLAFPIAAFLVAHVVSTFVRSRSAWIAFDFIAATVFSSAIWFLGKKLAEGFAIGLIQTLSTVLAVFIGVAILAAGAFQLASGRTDRVRSHRELSRSLWIMIGIGMLVLFAYVMWVVSVQPSDLRRDRFFIGANNGSWAMVGGTANHRGDYFATFLYNLDNGRAMRVPQMQPWWGLTFSADSNVAYWTLPNNGVEDIWMARLDTDDPKPIETKIALKRPSFFNFSNDGSRLVVIGRDSVLTVYDVATGSSLGSARVPGERWVGFFVRPDLVRIYGGYFGPAAAVPIYEYDVTRKTMSITGELPARPYRFNGDRSLVLIGKSGSVEIHDASTGALRHAVPGRWTAARFLRDGRVAAIGYDRRSVGIFTAEGTLQRSVPLPGRGEYLIDGGGGLVVAAMLDGQWSSAVVDSDRGRIVRVERGMQPLAFGNAGPHLLCYTKTAVIVWNPLTGEKRDVTK